MVTTALVTVANAWWGVAGGVAVNLTWVYNSRATEWERLLPPELRAAVQPTVRPCPV